MSRGLALLALVAGAVLSCLLSWRANRQAERLRLARALGQAMEHAEQLHGERVRQQAVLEVLTARIRGLGRRLDQANLRACRLQQELSTVRGNYEALRVELEFQASLTTGATVVELAPREEPPGPLGDRPGVVAACRSACRQAPRVTPADGSWCEPASPSVHSFRSMFIETRPLRVAHFRANRKMSSSSSLCYPLFFR